MKLGIALVAFGILSISVLFSAIGYGFTTNDPMGVKLTTVGLLLVWMLIVGGLPLFFGIKRLKTKGKANEKTN